MDSLLPKFLALLASSAVAAEAPSASLVKITSDPPGIRVTITSASDQVVSRKTPFHALLSNGWLEIEAKAPGRNPLSEKHLLDGPWSETLYLDPGGQRLHRVRSFKTGQWPKQVALTPDGKELWVTTLGGPPSLYVHDAST